jgi:hypothetical protein
MATTPNNKRPPRSSLLDRLLLNQVEDLDLEQLRELQELVGFLIEQRKRSHAAKD